MRNKKQRTTKKSSVSKKNTKSGYRNKTMKKYNFQNSVKSKIVCVFLEMINLIKLYHWNTRSFSHHKATDELYEKLNENIDRFIEVLLGKDQSRVSMVNARMELIEVDSMHEIKLKIHEYLACLIDFNRIFDSKRDSDLLNIRDEILADLNQFLYLLSLKT